MFHRTVWLEYWPVYCVDFWAKTSAHSAPENLSYSRSPCSKHCSYSY